LNYGKDPAAYKQHVNELKGRFGLTQEQIDEAQENWNYYYSNGVQLVPFGVPSKYHNA
jgi:hypothetical protein